jgi:hypothetical protein
MFKRAKIEKDFKKDPNKYSDQDSLNRDFNGVDVEMASRKATVLNIIFVVFFYSAAFPFFYILGGFTLCTLYLVEKYAFLNMFNVPPAYDDSLQKEFIVYLPFALLLHAIMAFFFFSSYNDEGITTSTYPGLIQSITARAAVPEAIPSLIVIILFVLYETFSLLNKIFHFKCLYEVIQRHCLKHKATDIVNRFQNHGSYWQEKRNMSATAKPFESYRLYDISKVKNYVHAFRRTPSLKQLRLYAPHELVVDSRQPPLPKNYLEDFELRLANDREAKEEAKT